MNRRAAFLYGALGGLSAAAALTAVAIITGIVDTVLDHLVGAR